MNEHAENVTLEEWFSYLEELHDKGDGLVTFTLDPMFKKACYVSNVFLIHLLHKGLQLPPDSVITDARFESPDVIPHNLNQKAYKLDMLVRFKLNLGSGKITMNLVNIEIYHSRNSYIIKKFTSYAVRLFDSQVLKGSDARYGDIKDVYSLVIIKDKLPFFKATKLYHHHHNYGVQGDPDSGISLPGPKYSIIELGKLEGGFHEMTTEAKKLWYFIKYSDNVNMSLEEAKAILIQGGPVAEAQKIQIAESLSEENRKMLEYVVRERAHRVAWGQERFAKGEAEGEVRGEVKAQIKFAQKLAQQGFASDKIAELTGLSVDEVKKIGLAHGSS